MGAELDVRWVGLDSSIGSVGPRFANTNGTPILSMVRRDLGEGDYIDAIYNGQMLSDVYTLTFSGTGTVCHIAAATGAKNPWNDATGVAIVADDSTPHDLVIGGLRIVFDSSLSDSDVAVVAVGSFLTAGGIATPALNFGAVKNDGLVYGKRYIVKNIGDADAHDIKLRPTPALYYTGTDAETILARLGPHWSPSRDQLAPAGGLSVTFDTWTDQTTHYTANVNVGGSLAIATAKFDGETRYGYGDGIGYVDLDDRLEGLEAVFAKITADPTAKTVSVVVLDGWQWAVLADDAAGAPGTYQGSQLSLGALAAGELTYCWLGVQIPEGTARGALRGWTPKFIYEEV